MSRRLDMRVLVAGGGVVGSTVALALARAGARVMLADPSPPSDSASGVAAGMLAPVFETLFDPAGAPLALLRDAREAWPPLAVRLGLKLDRSGTMAVASVADLDDWEARLAMIGAPARRLPPSQARRASPWLAPDLGGLWTDEDWRLEPADALAHLRGHFEATGGVVVGRPVVGFAPGMGRLAGGFQCAADALVIATGASRSPAGLAPELDLLTPIKGHILRAPGAIASGPVLRATGVYICPSSSGAMIGATMEPGRRDAAVDDEARERLRRLGGSLVPSLAGEAMVARTGVRAATPDGLPMVGRSRTASVWLAVGARRNGWLLAPLIADLLIGAIAEEAAGEWGASLAPERFCALQA